MKEELKKEIREITGSFFPINEELLVELFLSKLDQKLKEVEKETRERCMKNPALFTELAMKSAYKKGLEDGRNELGNGLKFLKDL